jgi:uncharacterized protein with LGFP repeats
MANKINNKRLQNTWLGGSLTGYISTTSTAWGTGMYVDYQSGSIYIGNNVGEAYIILGLIRNKWRNMGAQNSILGYPTTDELTCPDGVGRFNHFQYGSLYYHPDTGTFQVGGAIRDKWASLGWETGFLGYPTTDETTTPDGIGRFNHFQGGSIYWHPGSGAHETHGLIRSKWASLGWETSDLGYPISDELVAANGGRYSEFQGGRIYYHPNYGTYVVKGKIYINWADKGGPGGTYGYPISDQYSVKVGTLLGIIPLYETRQNFQYGTISVKQTQVETRIDLRGEINRRGIAIRNQGSRGTCSVFAMNFLLEYQYTGLFGASHYNDLSEEYLNHMTNKASNITCDGDIFSRIAKGYETYGIIRESLWPYQPNVVYNYADWDKKVTQAMLNEGKFMIIPAMKLKGKFIKELTGTAGLTDDQFSQIISYLNRLIPVAVGRSHSMVIVGYEYNSSYPGGGYFIFRNSWGLNSGDQGYVTEDFQSVKNTANDVYVYEKP